MGTNRRETEAFARRLNDLKQRGCNLLVVNDAESAPAVCGRLLGDPGEQRRHLFIPTTTTMASVLSRHDPFPKTPDRFGVVDGTTAERTRSLASPQRPGDLDANAEWYTELDRLDDLLALGRLVDEHLSRFEAAALSPGEVRVCMESLDPLIDVFDPEELFRFLHLLTARVRALHGIGHFHMATGLDSELADLLEPLFDVTIRSRETEEGVQQRWRLHDSGYDSGWLSMHAGDSTPRF